MAKTSPAAPAQANPADVEPAHKDWPAQATETIVTQVGNIRDKTTGPVLQGVHYAVFAAFAISLGTVALIIMVVGAVRFLDIWVPGKVWSAYTILGSVLLLVGVPLYFVKAKRHRT